MARYFGNAMRKFIIAGVCFFLTGCVTLNGFMTEYLGKYFGEDIKTAYRSLGYPKAVRENYDGTRTHVWSTTVSGIAFAPAFNNTSGYIGNTNFQARSTSYTPYSYSTGCTIELTTDKNDKVQHWGYNGSVEGCLGYANMLEQYWDGETSWRFMH